MKTIKKKCEKMTNLRELHIEMVKRQLTLKVSLVLWDLGNYSMKIHYCFTNTEIITLKNIVNIIINQLKSPTLSVEELDLSLEEISKIIKE